MPELEMDYDEMLKAEIKIGLEQLINSGIVELFEDDNGTEKYRIKKEELL